MKNIFLPWKCKCISRNRRIRNSKKIICILILINSKFNYCFCKNSTFHLLFVWIIQMFAVRFHLKLNYKCKRESLLEYTQQKSIKWCIIEANKQNCYFDFIKLSKIIPFTPKTLKNPFIGKTPVSWKSYTQQIYID